jgi:hypothetical protein
MDNRAAFEKGLNATCDVYRKSPTVNAFHEKVGQDVLHEASVPCSMAFPTGRKVVLPLGVDPSKSRIFYFKHDADIVERDLLKYGGRSYIVNSVDSTWGGHHVEAMCETVLGG